MKRFHITVNGVAYDVQVDEVAAGAPAPVAAPTPVAVPAPATPAAPAAPAAAPAAPADAQTVSAPMPGTIVNVPVSAGQQVTKGQVLVVMEAMKMENEIMAPSDGTVASVMVKKGDSVENGTPLVALQ